MRKRVPPRNPLPAKFMEVSKLRWSLAALFLVTTASGLACAALVNANAWWWSGVYTGSFLSLVVSLCAAIFAKGAVRAFAVGVLVTSALYAYHFVAPYLPSDLVFREFEKAYWAGPTTPANEYREHCTLIWYTLWGGPYSLFGGLVARFIYRKHWEPMISRRPPAADTASPSEPPTASSPYS